MIVETQFTVEDFRNRIQAMSDERLLRYGKAARYMADPRNSADEHTVRDVYVTQLQLCREEWARRHPKLTTPPREVAVPNVRDGKSNR
jgi:hypothetical protein